MWMCLWELVRVIASSFVCLFGWLVDLFVCLVGWLVDWFVLFCFVLFFVFVCSWF